jgi:hypothetical protein
VSTLAVERALIILKHVASSHEGLGVREIAKKFGYCPSVAQKILISSARRLCRSGCRGYPGWKSERLQNPFCKNWLKNPGRRPSLG